MKLVIIDYGAGNLFSVAKAFERLGIAPVISADKAEILSADSVVFPGVGHAKTAMEQLGKSGLTALIPELKQPVLGICLGMQLMCRFSEEGNVQGLGIFDTNVVDLNRVKLQLSGNIAILPESGVGNPVNSGVSALQIPHIGWNDVHFPASNSSYYFVHSFAAEICLQTWGSTDYIKPFSAALKKDNFFGVQFHPEKSGKNGEIFLNHFINQTFNKL